MTSKEYNELKTKIIEALVGQRYPISNMDILGFRLDESKTMGGEHTFVGNGFQVFWDSETNHIELLKR